MQNRTGDEQIMDKKLIYRLKQFYILETFQVAYYQAQVDASTDEYYTKAFEKMVKIEQGHADYFANKIELASETVPELVGSVFDLTGSILGETAEAMGQRNTCKFGAALEKKAMQEYQTFIQECKENNYLALNNDLMDYLLDEHFHTLWLTDYSKKLNEE